jgi:hypothetical protein
MKTRALLILAAISSVCIDLLPKAEAVNPPPDGPIPILLRLKGKTPFRVSPAALETVASALLRCLPTAPAASTPLLALEHFGSVILIQTPP